LPETFWEALIRGGLRHKNEAFTSMYVSHKAIPYAFEKRKEGNYKVKGQIALKGKGKIGDITGGRKKVCGEKLNIRGGEESQMSSVFS